MKTNCSLAIFGALLLSYLTAPLCAENAQFRSRLATWQNGASGREAASGSTVAESVDRWVDGDHFEESDPACCPDACGECMDWTWCGNHCGPRLWWIRNEGLLAWRKGRDLPPLVTTSDVAVPPPGTTVLYGGGTETSSAVVGGRFDFGTWLQCDEFIGVGGRLWGLANDDSVFAVSSTDLPNQTIERPFIQAPNTPNSLVIADPFTGFDGNIRITGHSETYGGDIYVRVRCYQSCLSRTDFVTGYQFARINESLQIHSETQTNTLIVNDNYFTNNEFHGGILGILHTYDFGCVNLSLLARVGLGNMRQTATGTGSTNGQAGGLLVESNTTLVRDQFCSAPELGVTLGYQFSPCMRMNVGYTLLAWSNVARPEGLIDNVRGDGTSIILRDSSFWVQGFNAGLTWTF